MPTLKKAISEEEYKKPSLEIEDQLAVIPLVDYTELRETAIRYKILKDHIEAVRGRGEENFPGFSIGLFKAVVGWEEKEKGETNETDKKDAE